MNTRIPLLAVALSGMVLASQAAVAVGTVRLPPGTKIRKVKSYCVIQVLMERGEVEFQVVGARSLEAKRELFDEQYKSAVLAWLQARREAERAKEPFDEKRPVGPRCLKVWPDHFKSKGAAQEFAQRLRRAWDTRMAKKRGADTD